MKRYAKHHHLRQRLEKLNAEVTFPPTDKQCKEYERINKIRMEARKKAVKQCRKAVRWRTIKKLGTIADASKWLAYSSEKSWSTLRSVKKKYYKLKKKGQKLRSTLIETQAKAEEDAGNITKAQALHKKLSRKKEREKNAHLCNLKKNKNKKG
eukprot:5779808-Ditylum_brightwellii.AAC.1